LIFEDRAAKLAELLKARADRVGTNRRRVFRKWREARTMLYALDLLEACKYPLTVISIIPREKSLPAAISQRESYLRMLSASERRNQPRGKTGHRSVLRRRFKRDIGPPFLTEPCTRFCTVNPAHLRIVLIERILESTASLLSLPTTCSSPTPGTKYTILNWAGFPF